MLFHRICKKNKAYQCTHNTNHKNSVNNVKTNVGGCDNRTRRYVLLFTTYIFNNMSENVNPTKPKRSRRWRYLTNVDNFVLSVSSCFCFIPYTSFPTVSSFCLYCRKITYMCRQDVKHQFLLEIANEKKCKLRVLSLSTDSISNLCNATFHPVPRGLPALI
jgi:hypothetical protein